MESARFKVSSSGEQVDPRVFTKRATTPSDALTKILLVQFRNGEAVDKHPELTSLLDDGWSIRSAVPRIVEAEGTKLLVVLARPGERTRAALARKPSDRRQLAES